MTVVSARANDDRKANGADCSRDGNYANVVNCSQSTKVPKRAWEAFFILIEIKESEGKPDS
jgi:hypothetical protein